jgi:hypothetical protein
MAIMGLFEEREAINNTTTEISFLAPKDGMKS